MSEKQSREKPTQRQKQKEKESAIQLKGVVVEAFKGSFKVKIPSSKQGGQDMFVLCQLAGKLRKNSIKIVPGDRVKVEISPYDVSKGRIFYRLNMNEDIVNG